MNEPIIEVKNISKRYRIRHQRWSYTSLRDELVNFVKKPFRWLYGHQTTDEDFWALKDVSFSIERGEILGIIGANGAGKSTFLKILSRITPPTTGEVVMHGKVGSLLEVGTGFHPELTGRENIFLNGTILGMSRKEVRRKFDEIVAFAEIEKFLDTPVKHYSSGMYVRLAFSIAAHLEPEILIVDEVLAVGDSIFQKKSIRKMEEVTQKDKRTILLVSHNMLAIQSLCKRVVLLEKGRVKMIGPANEVIEAYLSNTVDAKHAIKEYEEDKKKDIQIRKISILNNEGSPTLRFDIRKPLIAEIEYEVNREVVSTYIGCVIRKDDFDLCMTTDADRNSDMLRTPRKPGRYKTRVQIPDNILNVGRYVLRFRAEVQHGDVLDAPEDFMIEMHAASGEKSVYSGGERPFPFYIDMNWDTKALN